MIGHRLESFANLSNNNNNNNNNYIGLVSFQNRLKLLKIWHILRQSIAQSRRCYTMCTIDDIIIYNMMVKSWGNGKREMGRHYQILK